MDWREKMYIQTPNFLFELLARIQYLFLHHIKKVEPIAHVEYRHHRWYKLDRHCKVVKVSRTYFDIMQPC